MNRAFLAVMTDTSPVPVPSVADRIQRLQAEARSLASEHVNALISAMAEVEQMAADVAVGGDAYPVGVRNEARTLAAEMASRIQTITAIHTRSAR